LHISDFATDIDHCLDTLHAGGTILYPTDTIWGIGCDATNANAVEKVFSIKQRPLKKSLIVLLADERDILKYVSQPDPAIFNYLHTLKKPTTIIYTGPVNLAENLSEEGTIAIRLIKEEFCRHLIKRFRKPIVSTSANISGEPTPTWFGAISDKIIRSVDYTVQFRREDQTPATASSVVKYQPDGTVLIIRE
jgi:L-threonylcarbamoyladenylate synthase